MKRLKFSTDERPVSLVVLSPGFHPWALMTIGESTYEKMSKIEKMLKNSGWSKWQMRYELCFQFTKLFISIKGSHLSVLWNATSLFTTCMNKKVMYDISSDGVETSKVNDLLDGVINQFEAGGKLGKEESKRALMKMKDLTNLAKNWENLYDPFKIL